MVTGGDEETGGHDDAFTGYVPSHGLPFPFYSSVVHDSDVLRFLVVVSFHVVDVLESLVHPT